ncbi:MAG: nucleoside-diphosphate kinase [Nitrospiraceae bacterium]|nr:nucleoside-diphosphate kinase [Nitrospiraceae bacterium]
MVQRTLSIIKPDAVQKNAVGAILKYFEDAGLKIRALKMMKLSTEEAKAFYIVHRERPFYNELATFMSEGPIVPLVLEGEDAIKRVRDIMGATNPKDAAPGTIRATFATNIERNAVHGSDSEKSAAYEIPFFFSALEMPEI